MWLLYVPVTPFIVFSFSNSAIFLVDIFNCLKVGSFEASFTVLFSRKVTWGRCVRRWFAVCQLRSSGLPLIFVGTVVAHNFFMFRFVIKICFTVSFVRIFPPCCYSGF